MKITRRKYKLLALAFGVGAFFMMPDGAWWREFLTAVLFSVSFLFFQEAESMA